MVYAYGFCLDDRRIKNAADPCSKCIWTCNFMFYYAHVMSVADFLICQYLQKGKYKKDLSTDLFYLLYLIFIICTILHLTGVADYIETMPAAHAILIITFLAVILTFWIRYWNHRSRSDCLLFFGLLITMLSVIFEAISVYYKVSVSGVFVVSLF